MNSFADRLEDRFQADANLDPDIGRGLLRRLPQLDYRLAGGVISDGMRDPEVLELCARSGRLLVTEDIRSMPRHVDEFIATRNSPGLILVPRGLSMSCIIGGIAACWFAWAAEEMRNQSRWLPK